MAPPPIRAEFRRSGGLAGVPLTATVSEDELTDEQAAQLRGLLADGQPEARDPAVGPGGADRFHYQLDLDDGQRHRSFSWDETNVPDPIRPLLTALTRLARPGTAQPGPSR